MSKMAIVVVGYNRVPGMLRLLQSLENAKYSEDVTLIVSVDNCGSNEVADAAKAFTWTHREKRVRTFAERQGLRKHILSCGEYLREFDAIAVLEDDLIVSPAFYNYMKQCVAFYKDNKEIAGISLYTHKINVNTYLPFVPEAGANDVFFMQFAQSWGQVWMREQWFEFKEWYEKNCDESIDGPNVPELIVKWPKTSWLKYHIKYCIENNKYFVYPYDSLTTCFSDVGEHCKEENNNFQVPLMAADNKVYRLSDNKEDIICYDAYFERCGLEKILNLAENSLCVDLYGAKHNKSKKRYLLTREELPYKVMRTYALTMRPHECNIVYGIEGTEVKLYDTEVNTTIKEKKDKFINYKTVAYYFNMTAKWKCLMDYIWTRIKMKIKR